MHISSRYVLAVIGIALIILVGCRNNKDARSPSQPPPAQTPSSQPSSAIVKITSTGVLGSGVLIGGVRIRLILPKGVIVKATPDSGNTSVMVADKGVVKTLGVASGANSIATYAVAKTSMPGTVLIHLAHANGFGTGDLVTIACDVEEGSSPKKDDFIVAEFKAVDLNGAMITGITAGLSVDIK
jgi:hypothetical protein